MSELPPSEGALSISEAVSALQSRPEPVEQQPAETPEPEISAESTAEDAPEPQEAVEGEQQADPEAPVEATPAPAWWTAEQKARFADLPADVQQIIAATEGNREQATSKAKQEAAEARKRADAELAGVTELSKSLAEFLPKAVETFQSRWEGVDWAALPAQVGAEEAFRLKALFDQEQVTLRQVAVEKTKADELAHATFVKAEMERLAELAPPLVDPKDGPKLRSEVANYLMEGGIGADAIKYISASEMTVAWKAMQWDRAQAGLKARPAPQPAPKALKPSSGQATNSTTRSAEEASKRLSATGSINDAVAFLRASRRG